MCWLINVSQNQVWSRISSQASITPSRIGKVVFRVRYIFEMFLFLNFFHRMSISDRCETEKIRSLVEHHVPKAKLSQQHEAELTFTLPFESMDTFPGKNPAVFKTEGERERNNWNSNHCHLNWVKLRFMCFYVAGCQ